jgi:hypothetical protein
MKLLILILWAGSLTSPVAMDREAVAGPSLHEGRTVLECEHDSKSALVSSDFQTSNAQALVNPGESAEEEDDHGPDTPTDLNSFPPPAALAAGLPSIATCSRTGIFRKAFRNLPLRC